MVADADGKVHFFHELSFQAIPGSFAEFEPAARELGVIVTPDVLV
jgi:hypothetical protein